jgi:glycogen synthase
MKVLLTADTMGGVWTYAADLCRALLPLGVDVTLATMGERPGPAQRADVRGIPLHESDYSLEWMPDPWTDVAAAGEWLLELERRVRPDVVHLNGYVHAALPWSAPVLVAGHSCVLSWWRAVHGCAAPPEWSRYRSAVTRGLRAAALVVAPTRSMLDALQHHYGPLARTRVIPNGRAATWLPFGVRDGFGRYPGHSTLPSPLVLAAGRVWDESKDMATLAAAAPLMRWPVFVAGPDRDPAGRRHRLEGVHQLGNLTPGALRAWYRRAAVFVQPSLYEPFGLAPLEAARAGAALVLSDIPSLREVWADVATYVAPRDSRGLAAAVNALAGQPALLAERAAAALQRARALTARTMALRYHGAYREVSARAAGRDHDPMAGPVTAAAELAAHPTAPTREAATCAS